MANLTVYAIVANSDEFDANGNLNYPAGAVVSYTTILPPQVQLDANNQKAVDLGKWPNGRIDFTHFIWSVQNQALLPITPPVDAATALLAKPAWNATTDQEAALRLILGSLYGQ